MRKSEKLIEKMIVNEDAKSLYTQLTQAATLLEQVFRILDKAAKDKSVRLSFPLDDVTDAIATAQEDIRTNLKDLEAA